MLVLLLTPEEPENEVVPEETILEPVLTMLVPMFWMPLPRGVIPEEVMTPPDGLP